MEVVAKKANMMPAYILIIIVGLAFMVGLSVLGVINDTIGALVLGLAIGGALLAMGIVFLVKFVKLPKELITYADGKFNFADGTSCTPDEITHVLIKLTRSYGVVNPTGGIVITINDSRKIEYKTVMKVKQAQQRMQEITNEYFARLAEQENAEHENAENGNPPAEEIFG